MSRKIVRTLIVEVPLALALVGSMFYFYVTPESVGKMLVYFAVALIVLGAIETIIHEGGHVVCGLLLKAPITAIRIGGGPSVVSWRNGAVVIHMAPWGGRVDFRYLPLSRRQRIAMYASGVGASLIAAVAAWFVIPAHFGWLRTETVLTFVVFSAVNLFGTAPEGALSDGAAIRGLLAYR
jgi:hypothetical protein